MKVVCLLGSPRKGGNTEILAQKVLEPLEDKGAQIQVIRLNELTYQGCQACMACKGTSEKCIISDDLDEVLESFREADVVVLASPVYYGGCTGQFKCFFDRTYAYLTPDYITSETPCRFDPGKKAALILAQGAPDETMFADVFPRYKGFLDWYGFREVLEVRAVGADVAGAVSDREGLLTHALEVGRKLAE